MIAGLINKFPYDFVVAKNITNPAQLKGGKGAVSGFGTSSEFAVRFALGKLGLDPQDVTLLQTGNETARLAALQSGQVRFTVLTAGLDLEAFDIGYKPLKLSLQPVAHRTPGRTPFRGLLGTGSARYSAGVIPKVALNIRLRACGRIRRVSPAPSRVPAFAHGLPASVQKDDVSWGSKALVFRGGTTNGERVPGRSHARFPAPGR